MDRRLEEFPDAVALISQVLQLELKEGQFQTILSPEQREQFPDAMLRLAQACIRLAELAHTRPEKLVEEDAYLPAFKGHPKRANIVEIPEE